MLVGVIGNLLYALSGLLKDTSPTGALWLVVVGRVISGMGAGEFVVFSLKLFNTFVLYLVFSIHRFTFI